jgi:surface antigen
MARTSRRKADLAACAGAICAFALLQGCAADMPLPDPKLDPLVTTSVSAPEGREAFATDALASAGTVQSDEASDSMVMANAVAAIAPSGRPINWQNPVTGSSGFIHGVTEARNAAGILCREFSALRTSYDGVRNYAGAICLQDRGWQILRFEKL